MHRSIIHYCPFKKHNIYTCTSFIGTNRNVFNGQTRHNPPFNVQFELVCVAFNAGCNIGVRSPWKLFLGVGLDLRNAAANHCGELKTNSCVNRVKTSRHHLVQESWESQAGSGPSAELSSPEGHLAINLWPGSMSLPEFLNVSIPVFSHFLTFFGSLCQKTPNKINLTHKILSLNCW